MPSSAHTSHTCVQIIFLCLPLSSAISKSFTGVPAIRGRIINNTISNFLNQSYPLSCLFTNHPQRDGTIISQRRHVILNRASGRDNTPYI
ncbi:hypothetical protein GGR51DRAFT_528801 [Nemania sp. FL0031]|nr:hypothetical protein GGR51DRAFT_528801 [Nemania sp. FL0031]